ncbi:MAG: glycosyl hydrolase 53 family protein [Muribaculaceae bacterium]|nr:glycosyl hydrolase 53 family protein [Muribaculaceae bacterium]
MKIINRILSVILFSSLAILGACTQDSPKTNPPIPESTPIDRTTFAKGADVSWLTELEKKGYTYSTSDGVETECMELLKTQCGVNSIRLRVWVNPVDGWNNIDDVMVKAIRANKLGLRLMIDFHFSDTWADPAQQATPAAWVDYNLDELKGAVADHVGEMMNKLAAYNIEPEWVQIGNESRTGMLYPLGKIDNGANFAGLVNAGYDAVKAIFPESKVIIHVDCGNELYLYTRMFDYLATNNGKYDMIGMSLYPEVDNWESVVNDCISNINTVSKKYGKPVMICEIGMSYDEADVCKQFISLLKTKSETSTEGMCKGIFYWEPESEPESTDGYTKGCFKDGMPTVALDAFKEN